MVAELRARFLPGKKTMKPFGTEFCDHIAIASYSAGAWTAPSIEPLAPLSLHPAAHVLHYASSCFEGFKAYRWADGRGRIFRLHDHVARMRRSAASMVLPVPDADLLAGMVVDLVHHNLADIPEPPASLYLRPTLIGTLKNIGAAAAPSTGARWRRFRAAGTTGRAATTLGHPAGPLHAHRATGRAPVGRRWSRRVAVVPGQ